LVFDVVVGLALVVVAAVLRPSAWLTVLGIGACVAAFGCWGVLDREVGERKATKGLSQLLSIAIVTARSLAAVIGILATLITIFSVLGPVLGTWIS
jgi:hypothetical protein